MIKYVNTSAINLTKNPIMHSRAKHIEIRHHFIQEHVGNRSICEFIDSKDQLVDITKPLDKVAFEFIGNELGICNPLE